MIDYDKIIKRLESQLKNTPDGDRRSEIEHDLYQAEKAQYIQRKVLAAEVLLDEINAAHNTDKLNAVKKALRDIAESV